MNFCKMTSKIIQKHDGEFAVFYNSMNGHHSLRALKYFPADSLLQTFRAKEYMPTPTHLTLQVDEDKHIHLFPEYLQYINHSCEPNAFFDIQHGKLVSLKVINKNEEISIFYPATEWDMNQPFECFCNTSSCLGKIKGASYLGENLLTRYRFAEHIMRKFNGNLK